jgi:hypothetical protein
MEIHENNYEIVYTIIVYTFILLGISFMYEGYIPRQYAVIVGYFLFKMITDYDKCTLSYIECKLRNVKKEDGYIYDFLHSIVDLKNTPHGNHFYIISFILLIFYFIQD